MKLTLKLRYHTTFGQSLWVVGNHALLGAGDTANAVPLTYLNGEFWEVTISFPGGALPNDSWLESGYISFDFRFDREGKLTRKTIYRAHIR